MTDLAAVCDELAYWLPLAAELTTEPDITQSTGSSSKPGSRPPWNPDAALAVFDALDEIRTTEMWFRDAVTDRPHQLRPYAQIPEMLAQIPRLGEAMEPAAAQVATRNLRKRLTAILTLAAIGEHERIRRITGACCPYCGYPMLLATIASGRITCSRQDCTDHDGNHPRGIIEPGAASGMPLIAWADGTTQHPAA